MTAKTSKDLFARAQQILPGGVNSPVRAFKAVGGNPPFIARAKGARLWDQEGKEYLDYIGSWGPMILGHEHPRVVEAVRKQAEIGMSYGAPSALEVEMAELIVDIVPSIEMVRMVNSGTEATMSAIRLARAATGRDLIVKFEGCYHGHGDSFLSKAGSGAATFGVPTSPGVPKGAAECTLNARYNDIASVADLFAAYPERISCVIVEPVVGNMGCVAPADEFLQKLRAECSKNGALLIFDEVMTGFRVAPGGAQERFGVTPDLTTMGKVIGGGLPVGAYGGRRDLMERIAPAGPVYQAGTLSGNPLAMAAGIATLRELQEHPEIYGELERRGAALESMITDCIKSKGYPCSYGRVGSMATLFFYDGAVRSWEESGQCNTEQFGQYFGEMLAAGIHMPPAQFEAFFLSAAHTDDDITRTAEAMTAAMGKVLG
ncbi:glutamate-1-semialdehyde 2,1-aminomutase [bacterium]|nr:glutamate-1-semialdehyde 2,1-aminomutase [bacterium]